MGLVESLYHKLSGWPVVRAAGKVYRRGTPWANKKADERLKALKATAKKKDIINVVFIGQSLAVWGKLKSVFEAMLEDESFNPTIVAIKDVTDPKAQVYEYFSGLYGDRVIEGDKNGKIFDLKNIKPDYVFYQRPYDQYMYKEYQSNVVSEYAKICYTTYGYEIFGDMEDISINKLFFRNVYFYFAESHAAYLLNYNRFKESHDEGYRNSVEAGYPALEDFMLGKNKYSSSKEDAKLNILWTPRWSEDKEVGGSNFLKFKDKIIDYFEKNEALRLTFRPHPLTFSHFVSVGKMTEEEADAYKARFDNGFDNGSRFYYDNQPDYVKTFWESDIMLTDISSVVVEYFLTGRPIIYCDTGATPNTAFAEMISVMYVANSWEEARAHLDMLKNGEDPKREERLKKKEELFGSDILGATSRFLEVFKKDCQ